MSHDCRLTSYDIDTFEPNSLTIFHNRLSFHPADDRLCIRVFVPGSLLFFSFFDQHVDNFFQNSGLTGTWKSGYANFWMNSHILTSDPMLNATERPCVRNAAVIINLVNSLQLLRGTEINFRTQAYTFQLNRHKSKIRQREKTNRASKELPSW